jgi:hypothetical protein
MIRGTASSRNAMFGRGNMSLEGRRKGTKVTSCGGGVDVMCCPIGSEMWICRGKKKKNKHVLKLHI